jgi:hypothetical protein
VSGDCSASQSTPRSPPTTSCTCTGRATSSASAAWTRRRRRRSTGWPGTCWGTTTRWWPGARRCSSTTSPRPRASTNGYWPPTVTVAWPASTARFAVGQSVTISATATDVEDGALPGSAITWTVTRRHATHTHPFAGPTPGSSIAFTYPAPEDLAAADQQLPVVVGGTSRATSVTVTHGRTQSPRSTYRTSRSTACRRVQQLVRRRSPGSRDHHAAERRHVHRPLHALRPLGRAALPRTAGNGADPGGAARRSGRRDKVSTARPPKGDRPAGPGESGRPGLDCAWVVWSRRTRPVSGGVVSTGSSTRRHPARPAGRTRGLSGRPGSRRTRLPAGPAGQSNRW